MSCIVFTLATAPGLVPVEGAAPWSVLARQLPRQLVVCLNGPGDRGVRFVPLIGVVEGRRRFLDPVGAIPIELLAQLVGDRSSGHLIAGEIDQDRLRMRVHALPTMQECVSLDIEFDPLDPLPALRRVAFELGELVGTRDVNFGTPVLPGPALSRWLEARDVLLALDANLLSIDSPKALSIASAALMAQPGSPATQEVFRDVALQLARRGMLDHDGVRSLEHALARAGDPATLVLRCAQAVECALGARAAVDLWRRAVHGGLSDNDALAQAAAALFAAGEIEEVRRVLRRAIDGGCRDPGLRAQLAAVEDVGGDPQQRDLLLGELWSESHDGLPPRVARLVASWLVDRDSAGDALALLDRCVGADSEVPGVWLERGRALVALSRVEEARGALRVALERGLSSEGAAECRRLLNLCSHPDLVPGMLAIERALHSNRLSSALSQARRLVRFHGEVAETWSMLGAVHVACRNGWRALRAYRRALSIDPASADAHARLGCLLAARGRAEEGISHLRHAAELSPREPSIWVQLARICEEAGRCDEAVAAFRRAVHLGASSDEARNLAHRLGGEGQGRIDEGHE